MRTTKKYYAMIPSMFSFDGEPYWLELLQVKTLTAAQHYVDQSLGGLNDAEIGMSINGEDKVVVSKKNHTGQWEVVYESESDDPYINDQIQYYRHGKRVSEYDFFKYGFQHEKVEETENTS